MNGDQRFRSTAVGVPAGRVEKLSYGRGLTLIEVALVLAIMVVIASFCWPAISQAFSNQRLKKSAEIVRTQWSKSRVKAMSSGCIVLFRYEINGSRYRIEELGDSVAEENTSLDNAAFDSNAHAGVGASDIVDFTPDGGTQSLPKSIVFRESEIENDSRATTVETGQASSPATSSSWSNPIYFYPDGTSSSARLQIGNDRNYGILLSLRGMTGVVTVGEIAPLQGASP